MRLGRVVWERAPILVKTPILGIKAAVVACIAITIAYLLLQPFPAQLYVLSNTSEAAFSLVALLVALDALKVRDFPMIKSTRWLALGFLFWFLGEATYSIYALVLGVAIPYPSLADVFWLTGYPFVPVGMAIFLRQFRFAVRREDLAIAVGASVAAIVLVAVFLIIPVIAISTDLITNLVGFAYPILDVALLSASIVGALLFRGGRMARGWNYLVLGAILFALGDMLFSYAAAKGVIYDGDPLELLYDYGYVCFGLSIYRQLKAFGSES